MKQDNQYTRFRFFPIAMPQSLVRPASTEAKGCLALNMPTLLLGGKETKPMNKNTKNFFAAEDLEPPATEEKVKEAEAKLGIVFPAEYKEFMLESNGAEGDIGENSYLAIWNIEEIVELNEAYNVNRFTPGLVYFGSDGGGMAYAFDNRSKEKPIVTFPFDSIHIEDAELCGHTFNEFLQYLLWNN